MTPILIRSVFVLMVISSAAFAQDLTDTAKYAQPPIPSLLPAAMATAEANAAAKAKAAQPAATTTTTTTTTTTPSVATPDMAVVPDGHVVSPTPILVSDRKSVV